MLASLFRQDSQPQNLTAWGDWGPTGETWAGANVTHTTALQLLTVYGCNRFICDGISTLPVDTLRRRPDGSPEPIRSPKVITNPTSDLDFTSWATQVLTSLLMAGNFYGLKVWSGMSVEQVIPLDPTQVQVRRDGGRKVFVVNSRTLSTMDVMHIPAVMWPGSDVGLSPLEAARQTIGHGAAAQEFGARFFGQGAVMSGVVEVPGELTPDQSREIARGWQRKHGGKDKAHLPGVLQGGATWKPTGVTNDQAQFLETQQFTQSAIASQMFQIDPSEMGLPVDGSSLTYANLEQRNARKVQVTFLPWITRLERALTGLLRPEEYVKLNVNGLLRGDTKTRFDAYRVALGPDVPFMEPNEARDFEDWSPLPETDGTDADAVRKLSVAEAVQKVYLGVDKIVTSDEARKIVNEAGGDLVVPGPAFGPGESNAV